MNTVYLLSLAAIVLLSSASHAGVCVGLAVGSGLLDKRKAVVMYTSAALIGSLVQGGFMSRAIIAPSSCAVLTTSILSTLPSILGVPLSLNFALYTSQVGCSIARTRHGGFLGELTSYVLAWLAFTALTMLAAHRLEEVLTRFLSRSRSPTKLLDYAGFSIISLSALMSFTVGANTFGYVFLFAGRDLNALALLCGLFVVGAATLSYKSIEQVAFSFFSIKLSQAISSLLVTIVCIQVATFLSIPVSASLVLVSSIFATGYASMVYVVKTRSYATLLALQYTSIPAALALGYTIARYLQ